MWLRLPKKVLGIAVSSFCLVACNSLAQPIEIELPGENGPDLKYRDTLIKVCGLATKEFENVQITEHRDANWRGDANGLGVNWLDKEPYTEAPEQRCVTGFLEPTCGWETFDSDEYEELLCLSTGYSFEWRINQVTLARN